ncbi:MAG: hypothetical protein IPK79_11485 [Vampirovibrionales bacterium]|nr:hypothetical protein [Vampirovibrionales bacterium]
MTQPAASSAHRPAGKKWAIPLVALAVLAIAAVGFWLWPRHTGPGLFVYYPENTAFFAEIETSQREAQGILTLVEREQAKARALLQQHQSAPSPPPSFLGERLTQDFVETFKPQFSIGAWPAAGNVDSRDAKSVRYLIVLPLKSDKTTGEALMARIGVHRYTRHRFRNIDYWVEKPGASASEAPMTLSVVNHALMMTGAPQAMEASIAQALDRKRNVFDNAALKAGLAKLPAPRQGTLITHSAVFAPDRDPRVRQFNLAMPAIFGAFRTQMDSEIEKDALQTRLTLDFFAPLKLAQVQSESLQKQMRQFLAAPKNPFRAARFFPAQTQVMASVGRLDALSNIIIDHGLSLQQKQNLMGAQFVLSMAEIDLRKDLIGLLGGEAAVGGSFLGEQAGQPPSAMALLSKTPEKAQTVQKLLKLASSGIAPLHRQTEQLGDVTADLFTLPNQSGAVGLATLQDSMIAIAPAAQLAEAAGVSASKEKSMADAPLYRELTDNLPKSGIALIFADMRNMPDRGDSPVTGFAGVVDSEGESAAVGRVNLNLSLPAPETP